MKIDFSSWNWRMSQFLKGISRRRAEREGGPLKREELMKLINKLTHYFISVLKWKRDNGCPVEGRLLSPTSPLKLLWTITALASGRWHDLLSAEELLLEGGEGRCAMDPPSLFWMVCFSSMADRLQTVDF